MSNRMDAKAIGERLRDLRIKKRKTLMEVSRETGIGQTALSNYEAGARIPRDEAKIILAQYYRVPITKLFFDTESTKRGQVAAQ